MMNLIAEVWPPVWFQIAGLDKSTYPIGLPLLFCLIALIAAFVGRTVYFATGNNPNNQTDSSPDPFKKGLWLREQAI